MKSAGIVIPTYNEKENILKLLRKIRSKLNCLIIIVDDSKDKEIKDIIKKKRLKKVKYFNRKKKLGRGSAVIFGLKKLINSSENISCFIEMDADMSHSPSELKRNIKFFYKNSLDLLIGSRYLTNSKILNWPLSRRLLSKLSNMLAKILLGAPVNDYTNGYRFYSKPATKMIISKCKNTKGGFIILSEIILVLWANGRKISEIKSVFKNRTRGESSVNLKLVLQSLVDLFKLYLVKKTYKF